MKRYFTLLAILLLTAPLSAGAQNEKHEVMAVIETLFEGMLVGDADMVASTFADGATLTSTGTRDGKSYARKRTAEGFVGAVREGSGGWDERIWDVEIKIEDNLASAWMKFAFYLNGEFSHCGVNTFHLARQTDGEWRTVGLADTRQSEKCIIDVNKKEESVVRSALRHYLKGHATGDGTHHEIAFNEVAYLYWVRDGELNQRSSTEYIAGASGEPAANESERVRYIDWVDVSGTTAVGKIVLDYPGVYIVDYMSLLKVGGRWQIVNKIFNVDAE